MLEARGKALVNAAGPWVADVLALAGGNAKNRVRLIKGSHIVAQQILARRARLFPAERRQTGRLRRSLTKAISR